MTASRAFSTKPRQFPDAIPSAAGAVNHPRPHTLRDSQTIDGSGESFATKPIDVTDAVEHPAGGEDLDTKPIYVSEARDKAAGVHAQERNDTAPKPVPAANQGAVFVSLRFHTGLLDDIEEQRKRQANQLLALTRDDEWGLALPDWHPTVETATRYLDELRLVEKRAIKDLELTFKLLPEAVQTHVSDTRGLGIKSVARYLGVVGDPAWHYRKLQPRKLRELYAYCGLDVRGGKAPRNSRGEQSNWNGKARMRVYNMMEPCIKVGGPYRIIYDEAKAMYMERGDIDSKAHINNRAKRIGMKAIVRDLWDVFGGELGGQHE